MYFLDCDFVNIYNLENYIKLYRVLAQKVKTKDVIFKKIHRNRNLIV